MNVIENFVKKCSLLQVIVFVTLLLLNHFPYSISALVVNTAIYKLDIFCLLSFILFAKTKLATNLALDILLAKIVGSCTKKPLYFS